MEMVDAAKPEWKKQGSGCELTSLEISLCREIFTRLLQFGRVPILKEASLSLKKAPEDIACVLDELEKKDLLVRRKGTYEIIAIYPISLTPTEHEVHLTGGKRLFAMCAVDALGVPNMFERDATIVSRCEWCKQEVTIEIEGGEMVSKSYPNMLIWSPSRQEVPAAETCCPLVNFFCSTEHLEDWKAKNPGLAERGHSTPLGQAYPKIRECWKSYGKIIGIR